MSSMVNYNCRSTLWTLRETETGNAHLQANPGAPTLLLQRRIGLCGDATRAPTGACKQQKGRTVFDKKAVPAPSICWSRKKAKNPPYPNQRTTKCKSINYSEWTAINYREHAHPRVGGKGSDNPCAGRNDNRKQHKPRVSGVNGMLRRAGGCC